MTEPGLPALQAAVTKLRDAYKNCHAPLKGYGVGGCPWPYMWDEDAAELHQALLEAGFAIARVRPA